MSTKLQENFPERDAKDFFIVPALDARSQVLSILDCRNGVEKPVFKLAHPGHEQLFDLTAPDLCVPNISDGVLRHVIREANQPVQNGAAYL